MTTTAHAPLIPTLFSLAMPGFGQFVQGRPLMAFAQLCLTGLVWTMAAGSFPGCVLIPLAHLLSAVSAARFAAQA